MRKVEEVARLLRSSGRKTVAKVTRVTEVAMKKWKKWGKGTRGRSEF